MITNLSENVFFMVNVLLLLCKQIIEVSQAWSRQTRGKKEIKTRVLKIFATWEKTNPGGHMGHNKDPTFHTIGGAGRKEGRGEG